MSDEIVDIEATSINYPEEQKNDNGLVIPDPAFVDESDEEQMQNIIERRKDLDLIPEYPKEWQEGSDSTENEVKMDAENKIPLNVSLKEQEINKLIKKYKKYLRSNLSEIRRLGEENNEG